jgi:toluene monooxygenase electron transfer component
MCQSTPTEDIVLESGATVYRMDPGACAARYFTGEVTARRVLARDILAFSLALDAPISYDAGQFVALTVPGIAGYRVYSITNFARNATTIDLLVKRKPGGAFSDWLFGASGEPARVGVFGPLGRATFSPAAGVHLVLIAGGSGIAGMMSILARAVQEGYFARHRGHVFFGVRAWQDAFYLDELSAMSQAFPGSLSTTVAFSDDDVPETARAQYPALAFARGFVHDVAREAMQGNYAGARVYVAGPPPAVDATLRYLVRDAKLSPLHIRYDKFG